MIDGRVIFLERYRTTIAYRSQIVYVALRNESSAWNIHWRHVGDKSLIGADVAFNHSTSEEIARQMYVDITQGIGDVLWEATYVNGFNYWARTPDLESIKGKP